MLEKLDSNDSAFFHILHTVIFQRGVGHYLSELIILQNPDSCEFGFFL